ASVSSEYNGSSNGGDSPSPVRPSSSWSTTIRERRAVIAPPEITNGSSSGSVSSNSSARAIRIGEEIEEAQLAVPPLQLTPLFEVQQAGDQSVARVEDQFVQSPLGARAVGRG